MAIQPDHAAQVAERLLQIETELRRMGAWETDPPPDEALQSTKPFAVDTLEFTQWLQFVFVWRMKVLIENEQPLPEVSGMAPMAEEHFRGRSESGRRLVRELAEMDRLLSGPS
ncbi:YqcC family protein [Marinobacter orientalis]|uniref:YqcC family protein n=1 Tax=Marinobacter orientalis TaxID=1928859 RepID=A0A7Y0RFQ3_9GAMM|nr:YqcC family protein [Marinobacter orientalis]NMT65373.1 YqcC family protein [Marinobacter orientalis]TGX47606.1 YqcC family protein [Marinobacter orientalis]